MAKITLVSTTTSSFTVKLTGLDTSWSGGKRTAQFYVNATPKNKLDIWNSPSETQEITLSGLAPDTKYNVTCNVYDRNNNLLSVLSGSFTTDASSTVVIPTIKSFSVEKSGSGIECSYTLSGVDTSTVYQVTIVSDGVKKSDFQMKWSSSSVSETRRISDTTNEQHIIVLTIWSAAHSVAAQATYYPVYRLDVSSITYKRIDSGLILSWTGAADAYTFDVAIVRKEDESVITKRDLTSNTVTVTNLYCGEQYTITVQGFRSGYAGTPKTLSTCKTAPAQPKISVTNDTGGVLVSCSYAHETYVQSIKYIVCDTSGTTIIQEQTQTLGTSDQKRYATSSDTYTLTGLSGSYILRVQTLATSFGSGWFECVDSYGDAYYAQITIDANSRPANWNWQASNGSATATATQKAHTAVTKKGYLTDFSYIVWNDLVNKVQEFMEYVGIANNTIGRTLYGYSSSTTHTTMLNGAKMTASDKVMTAKRFNIVRFCIGSMSPEGTGLNDFSSGDVILGSYFTTLTTKLNEIT